MRITSTSTYTTMRDSLSTSLSRVADLQSQLGSGRRINQMSDDPVGAATALRYRSESSDQDAFAAAADNANTWLGAADTSLQGMSTSLRRVRELAVQANNDSLTPEARSAIADELTSLRDELADLANTHQDGQALFGGFSGSAVTRDPATGAWTFIGDGGAGPATGRRRCDRRRSTSTAAAPSASTSPRARTCSRWWTASPRTPGPATAPRSSPTSPTCRARTQSVLGALGTVGATVNRVDAAKARGQQYSDQITAERSSIEDVDLAGAILQLTAAQNGYQAALGAVAKSNLPSLADFLH